MVRREADAGLGRPVEEGATGETTAMKVFSTSITLSSDERTEVWDITKLVREAVEQFPVSAGIVLVNTLHTTCTVFVNEFQSALVDDLKALVERLVPGAAATGTTIRGTRTASAETPTPTSAPHSSGVASPSASTTAS